MASTETDSRSEEKTSDSIFSSCARQGRRNACAEGMDGVQVLPVDEENDGKTDEKDSANANDEAKPAT